MSEGTVYCVGVILGFIFALMLCGILWVQNGVYVVITNKNVVYMSSDPPPRNGEYILLKDGKTVGPEDNPKIYKCFENE